MADNGATKIYSAVHHDIIQQICSREVQYSKKNIEKALASTGHKDRESAQKWLHSHKLDPLLNTESEREYIIFLCPTGPLLSEVSKFYEESYNRCGSNSAHNLFPHVTLSSFFKISDSSLPRVLDILNDSFEEASSVKPGRVGLSLQWCHGFIGLFLCEQSSSWLSDVLNCFVKTLDVELGITVKPQTTQYHLTLAYNFDLSKTADLSYLAKNVKIDAPVRWELNIYSRNTKFNGKQFQVVLHDYKAKNFDEIDLHQSRYLVMESETPTHKGWRKGTNFDTGKIGLFPESFTKKTAEWRLWTKNISLPITNVGGNRHDNEKPNQKARRTQSMNFKKDKKDHTRSSVRSTGAQDWGSPDKSSGKPINNKTWEPVILTSTAINPSALNFVRRRSLDSLKPNYSPASRDTNPENNIVHANSSRVKQSEFKEAKVVDSKSGRADMKSVKRVERENTLRLLQQAQSSKTTMERPMFNGGGSISGRRVFLMRHAERVDLTFGHDWFQVYIDDKGYHRRNLNLPRRIPTRCGGPKDFFMDGPISEIGTFQAKLIGEALRAKGVSFTQVFTSPSLRSVQTATSVLEGLMDTHTKIKVEPALFEWMAWCRNTLPKFMTVDELADYGFNVDRGYSPFYLFSQFNLYEKTEEYYYRSHSFVENELRTATGNVLMIGHSATLDVCSRQLTGNPIRKTDDLVRVVQKVPFCGLCTVEETINATMGRKWNLVQAPIPSLAHGQNSTFDWRVLESTVNGPPYGKGK